MRGSRGNSLNLANIFEVLGAWVFLLVGWNTQFSFFLAHEHESPRSRRPPPPDGRAVVMEEQGRNGGRRRMVVAEEGGKRRRRGRYKWVELEEVQRTHCHHHHKSENPSWMLLNLHLIGKLEEQWNSMRQSSHQLSCAVCIFRGQ